MPSSTIARKRYTRISSKYFRKPPTVLSQNLSRGQVFAGGDVIYGGEIANWLKLGNSLRLRTAMRVSQKIGDKARTEAEAAAAAAEE
jgi:hypothetical protein